MPVGPEPSIRAVLLLKSLAAERYSMSEWISAGIFWHTFRSWISILLKSNVNLHFISQDGVFQLLSSTVESGRLKCPFDPLQPFASVLTGNKILLCNIIWLFVYNKILCALMFVILLDWLICSSSRSVPVCRYIFWLPGQRHNIHTLPWPPSWPALYTHRHLWRLLDQWYAHSCRYPHLHAEQTQNLLLLFLQTSTLPTDTQSLSVPHGGYWHSTAKETAHIFI